MEQDELREIVDERLSDISYFEEAIPGDIGANSGSTFA
jgi:hypothetical protein